MTKGVLLLASNNEEINYIRLAELAAKRVSKFLNVPVSVITDQESLSSVKEEGLFDKIILTNTDSRYSLRTFRDGQYKKRTFWKNTHRDSVFDLTPYDETLVIDVDFVINSELLNYCWDQPHDFLIFKDSYNLASWKNNDDYRYVSQYSIPFYWATVFFFRKTLHNKLFFSLISHIKENWKYYDFLYQLSSPTFRNDFAFSIAIHIMNGMSDGDFAKKLPGKLYYTFDSDILVKCEDTSLLILSEKQQSYIPLKVSNLDVHIMNKYSLLRILEQ